MTLKSSIMVLLYHRDKLLDLSHEYFSNVVTGKFLSTFIFPVTILLLFFPNYSFYKRDDFHKMYLLNKYLHDWQHIAAFRVFVFG
jgi:hypothetical protein